MRNLFIRSLSGLVFAGLILGSLLAGSWFFGVFFLLAMTGCLTEFYHMAGKTENAPHLFTGLITGVLLFLASFLVASGRLPLTSLVGIFPFILSFFIVELYRKHDRPLQNIAIGILGLVYVAVPFGLSCFIVFREYQYSPSLMIALLSLIWIYDSGAYLFGVSLGKHRLFERISPKKSWEGAIGGALLVLGCSFLCARLIPIGLIHWIIISLLIIVIATLGDLSESLFKRQTGVKDSGNFIPGHGGLLDRFDSLLFTVPVFLCYLEIVFSFG